MSLQTVPLRKLLKILFLEPPQRRREVMNDITADARSERRRASGERASSGNFQSTFRSDAKRHVLETAELQDSVAKELIAAPEMPDTRSCLEAV